MPGPMSDAHLLIDGGIVCAYFAMITAIGLYLGRRDRSLSDFALAGRRGPWGALTAAIIAAQTGAATFLGVPGGGYRPPTCAHARSSVVLALGGAAGAPCRLD